MRALLDPNSVDFIVEIQNIIADQKPDIVHDKEAAVNYFSFHPKNSKQRRSGETSLDRRAEGKDQWVSFDDQKTLKQKADWANDLG